MKRTYIILGIVAVVLVAVLLVTFLVFNPKPSALPAGNSSNPFASSSESQTVASTSSPLLPVTLKDGSTAVVPNFITKNQPPTANALVGYQVDNTAPDSYQTIYFTSGSYFLITLNSEPLGEHRTEAENALRSELGLSDAQLCNLNIGVFTPGFASEQYAGENLGLSFCPGAVPLP